MSPTLRAASHESRMVEQIEQIKPEPCSERLIGRRFVGMAMAFQGVVMLVSSAIVAASNVACTYDLHANFTLMGVCGVGQYTSFPNTPCACKPCLAGTFQPTVAVPFNMSGMFNACRECEPGTHAMSPGSRKCPQCPDNTFSPTAGWGEECLTCDPGHVPNTKQTGCVACEPGTYWDASSSCKLCPNGTVNPSSGGTLLNCTTCPSVLANPEHTVCMCDGDPSKAQHRCPDGWVCPRKGPNKGRVGSSSNSSVQCVPVGIRHYRRLDFASHDHEIISEI